MYFLSEGSHPLLVDASHVPPSYGNFNLDVFYKRVQAQLHIVFSLNTHQVSCFFAKLLIWGSFAKLLVWGSFAKLLSHFCGSFAKLLLKIIKLPPAG